MKILCRSAVLLMIGCLCMLSFSSCGELLSGNNWLKDGEWIKTADAKAYINEFFLAIVSEDYAKAEGLLHPDRPADLETFLLDFEKDSGIDFQAGIETKLRAVSAVFYDSVVGGAWKELTMDATVGDAEITLIVAIVKNKNGYGIYEFNIEKTETRVWGELYAEKSRN